MTQSQLLTPQEVAELLRVTPRTIRNWAREGILEPVTMGGRIRRYRLADIERLIQDGFVRSRDRPA